MTQWTGTEHKEMEHVFVGIMASAVEDKIILVIKAVIDFVFFSQYHMYNSCTLNVLSKHTVQHREKSTVLTCYAVAL